MSMVCNNHLSLDFSIVWSTRDFQPYVKILENLVIILAATQRVTAAAPAGECEGV